MIFELPITSNVTANKRRKTEINKQCIPIFRYLELHFIFSVCVERYHKCYVFFIVNNLPWMQVQTDFCQDFNMSLVSLHSKEEQDLLGAILRFNGDHSHKYISAYIGKTVFTIMLLQLCRF